MKREATYCKLGFLVLCAGVIFTISGTLLSTLSDSSKSALFIFSFAFIAIGTVLFAVHHKRYLTIQELIHRTKPVIACWTYAPNSSDTINEFIKEQKNYSFATAILVLILSSIFSMIFAHSGGTTVLQLGYTFAVLCIMLFIIAIRFISAYYEALKQKEVSIIFGEDCIFFVDELYNFKSVFHVVQNISIYIGKENLLIFEYGYEDLDDSSSYSIMVPIPPNKLSVALHLKDYYRSIFNSNESD